MNTKDKLFMFKVKRVLAFYGFHSTEQLATLTERQVLKVKNCGLSFYKELYKYLKDKNLNPKKPRTLYPIDVEEMSDYELKTKIIGFKTSVTRGLKPQQQLDILKEELNNRLIKKGFLTND